MEIAVRLSPKQLDHVAPVLEEIIHEIVEERQKGIEVVKKWRKTHLFKKRLNSADQYCDLESD